MPNKELVNEIRSEDLDVSLSTGYIVRCKLSTFLTIRKQIADALKDNPDEFLVYSKASAANLRLTKEE